MRKLYVFALLLAAPLLFAQTAPLSTLQGKVTADGSPLPGVSVTVSSPNLQGTRTVTTLGAGDYIIPFLPPGDYKVTFELAGMQTVTRKVTLTAARTDRIDVALKPASVAEAITVTAETPLTAVVENTQVATNFKQDLIEQLPVSRSLQSITLLAPGVNSNGPGGNIMISGAMSFDSLYLVDGAIVNENLRGQAHNLFIEDAIQETTVHTGGISAEYGHFTGGVVNAITKSGGNDLKGSFRSSLTNESWTARIPGFTAEQEDKINPFYEATLGGPILRDRLWFFAAGRAAKTSDIRQTVPGLARLGDQDVNGVQIPVNTPIPPITYPHGTREQRLEGKITAAITPRHNLIATVLDIKASETNQTGQAIMDLDSLVAKRHTPNSFYALNYNGALTQNFFLEGQYSKKKFAFLGSGSPYYDLIKGTLITDRARGTRFWSPTFRATPDGEHRDHDLYAGKASYFLSTPHLGSHELKAGYEHFLEVRDVNNYQNGSDYRISISQSIVRGNQIFGRFTGGATGTATRISWLPILVLSEGSEYASDSFFLNDRWTLNDHWTFNLGARYDKNDAVSGDHTFQIAKDSAISPRLGLNYDVFANGKLTVIASWGQYVGRLSEGVGNDADPAGRNASFQWDYRGPSINNDVNAPTSSLVPTDKAIQMIFDWFFANGGTNRRPFRTPPSVPGLESKLDPDGLKSPNVKETSLGVASLLGTRGYVRADAIWRDWSDFYTSFVNMGTGKVTYSGTTYDQAIIRNDSDLYDRKYYAVQTQFSYRFWPRFTLGGTYTWSRLIGNVTGEDTGSGPLVGVAGERPEYRQASWNYPMGYLTGDQRHRARVWASFDVPMARAGDLNFSLLQHFDSGTRTSVDGSINPSPFVTNPGYIDVPTSVSYFFGGRGELKTSDTLRTDLAINYKIRLLSGVDFFIQPEILNIFNRQAVTSYDEEVLTNIDCNGTATQNVDCPAAGLKAFNPFTETPVEGVHYIKGPNFGLPNSEGDFQTPRTFRISMGLRF